MKRVYEKPEISVEVLELDAPVAENCLADKEDMNSLMEFGYFDDKHKCGINVDTIDWGDDTICYHSNVINAFTS